MYMNGFDRIVEELPLKDVTPVGLFLDSLNFPKDRDVLAHLTLDQFKAWVYRLNPRNALLIACSAEFKAIAESQHNVTRIKRIMKFLWRLTHGVPL